MTAMNSARSSSSQLNPASVDEAGVNSSEISTPTYKMHFYPQVWLLVVSFSGFALAVVWDLGLLQSMVALDRSYITLLIGGLLVVSTCHAAWHIVRYSQESQKLRNYMQYMTVDNSIKNSIGNKETPPSFQAPTESALEFVAEDRRAAVDLGWFLVDLAIRLGLVGTIIGFILIFTSLSGISIDESTGLKDLIIAMSGGMGTALYTTLCGLVAGTLMSFQYLILGRQTEQLISLMLQQYATQESKANITP